MIFVTVGAQMPFDRLIETVDQWAEKNEHANIYAQIGETEYKPKHIRWDKFVAPDELRNLVQSADVVVAHAGMGTILTALQLGKPIIVMPRRGCLRETRNDHQVATAKKLSYLKLVHVAWDEEELTQQLNTSILEIKAKEKIKPFATGQLCDTISDFIDNSKAAGVVDGVICFGGVDWWYHNRGHYDIQMMRELSRCMPVLYVNSIGMRTPSVGDGKVFFKRVTRKLKSWSRGLQLVRENFGVLSPVSVPKFHQTTWAKAFLTEQVKDAAEWMGIEHPLVWVACPPAAEVVDHIPTTAMVYQRTDRFEHYPGVNAERIRSYDLMLKNRADMTVFCSTSVFNDELEECHKAAFVDHGVDYQAFVSASSGDAPEDVQSIPHPRIGFVGGIDAHTFDPDLFLNVATAMPDCSFVMVGGCSLPEDWCTLANVHLLGRKPYEQVAEYMAACDVLIMPWNNNPWIKACNPVKLKEYMAVGRPIVTTTFDELMNYEGYVSIAKDAPEFTKKIRDALDNPQEACTLRKRVEKDTWAAKATAAIENLQATGIEFQHQFDLLQTDSTIDETVTESSSQPDPQTETLEDKILIPSDTKPNLIKKTYWRWSFLLTAGLLALIGLWVTLDAWQDILHLATRNEENSHIFLVIPVAIWIAWVRKEQGLLARRSATLVGPCMVLLGWVLFAVGDAQLYQSMWHLGAIMIVVGCAVSVLGSEILFRFWPSIVVLVFLIPVPGFLRHQIAAPLQTVTAQMTAYVLQILGEPVTLSGKVLMINDFSVGIAEACNGIRMMFALTLVCFLYAFGTELRTRTRILILLLSPVIAIIVNIIRLVPTVWLYGYAKEETALLFHDISGWAMMPIALFGLMGIGALMRWVLAEEEPVAGQTQLS